MYLYTKRDKILNKLGYSSYKEYLQSSVWKNIRKRILEVYKYACYKCGEYGNEVHHRRYTYSVLNGSNLSKKNYFVVCRQCHQDAEYDGTIKKTTQEANKDIGLKPYHIEYKYREILKDHKKLSKYTRTKKSKKCVICHKQYTPFKFYGRRVCLGCLPAVLKDMGSVVCTQNAPCANAKGVRSEDNPKCIPSPQSDISEPHNATSQSITKR